MDAILNAAVAYAQAKVDESWMLKCGSSDQYEKATARSDAMFAELRKAIDGTAQFAGDGGRG